jgi:hypothetical protein
MARRKQAAQAAESTGEELTAPQPPERASLQPPASAEPPKSDKTTAPPRPASDTSRTSRFPDPDEKQSLKLGSGKDAPRLRLLRSDRFKQMQIRSDEPLSDASQKKLKDDGWTERREEGIWTKQLHSRNAAEGQEPTPTWRVVLKAEQFFAELAADIRREHQLPPAAPERAGGVAF